jgi:hypothetical protein
MPLVSDTLLAIALRSCAASLELPSAQMISVSSPLR